MGILKSSSPDGLHSDCARLLARKVLVKLMERLKLSVLISKNVPLDKPRECLRSQVLHVLGRRHGKHIVEFFQGSLLGFWYPKEDHYQGSNVEPTTVVISLIGLNNWD